MNVCERIGPIFSPYLYISKILVIAVLGWCCEPQSWGRGGRRESEMVPFERALVSSYRPSILSFHLSLRVSEIAAFVLQHATFSHPTSSLPKISPGSRWMAFWLLRANMLDCPCS